ncbi:hypothetical protein FRC01_001179 [Tulasnella sp. 417]|nr:hypothetical protein FRC01_001179 [Tulasnella sp. 417]
MASSSSIKTLKTKASSTASDIHTPFILPKDKLSELQGSFKNEEKKAPIIRDLTEIHESTWTTPRGESLIVCVKYLRYATIIESDIQMAAGDRRRELKKILDQMIQWTSLKHPNILPFIGYQWNDTPVLVFSWYKNGNITQYLNDHPGLDRLKLLVQVASGLTFLHSKSIVHGGIKPANVIIADDGHPMLMDFGMAPDLRMVERNMTMADSGRENVGYMSPELIEKGSYTKASDVYAFASLILEVLSGQPPYYKLPYVQAMIQITQQKKPIPEDHQSLSSSSPLWDLMQRCWNIQPDDRPWIEEVRNLLEHIAKGKRPTLLSYIRSLCKTVFRLLRLRL